MHLEEMFEKYKDWKLLRIFLNNPDHSFYTKEISRDTGIGSGTVNVFLKNIHKDNILKKEIVGNVHLYSLNNESEIVKQMKTLNIIINFKKNKLTEEFLKNDNSIISIILYGSHANGEYDAKSDIDLVILVNKKKQFTKTIQKLESKIKKIISVQIFTISDWQKLKEKDKMFYESIIRNHIVFYGSGLP
jgi:predicted nucleotidyltransferase